MQAGLNREPDLRRSSERNVWAAATALAFIIPFSPVPGCTPHPLCATTTDVHLRNLSILWWVHEKTAHVNLLLSRSNGAVGYHPEIIALTTRRKN
jgi:hypothetical protein